MDIVGTDRDHLAAEIQCVERFDHHLVAFWAFEFVGAGILEIRHHMVDRRLNGIGGGLMELHVVAGISHLRARDDEAGAVIEYVHGSHLQSLGSPARSARLLIRARASGLSGALYSTDACGLLDYF